MGILKKKKHIISSIITISFAVFYTTSCSVFSDSLLIKIRDESKCNLKRYSFEMSEMTVSFSSAQVAMIKGERTELVVNIPIVNQEPVTFKYRVKAEYENCPEIVSQEREVKRGYVIYETIYDNKIDYAIRAR